MAAPRRRARFVQDLGLRTSAFRGRRRLGPQGQGCDPTCPPPTSYSSTCRCSGSRRLEYHALLHQVRPISRPGLSLTIYLKDQLRPSRSSQAISQLPAFSPTPWCGRSAATSPTAGIPVDVVPGITAGLALAATLGASLTHRNLAHSVRFVTGYGQHGDSPADLYWVRHRRPGDDLLVYMGGRTAGSLAARLLAGGLEPDTPACAVAALSRSAAVCDGPDLWRSWSWASRSSRPDSPCSQNWRSFCGILQCMLARPRLAS